MVGRNYTAVTLNMANNSTLTQYDITGTPFHPVPLQHFLRQIHSMMVTRNGVQRAQKAVERRVDSAAQGANVEVICFWLMYMPSQRAEEVLQRALMQHILYHTKTLSGACSG